MSNKSLILSCSVCGAKNRVPLARIDDSPNCGKCKIALSTASLEKPVDVTDQTFDQQVLSSTLPVLVDCWAPWCGPCKAFAPIIDALAVKYKARVKIAKLNVDENPIIGARYAISSVPTLLLLKQGQIIDKVAGALPKEQLEGLIGRILG